MGGGLADFWRYSRGGACVFAVFWGLTMGVCGSAGSAGLASGSAGASG